MNIGGSDDAFPVYQASGGFNPFLTLAFVFIVFSSRFRPGAIFVRSTSVPDARLPPSGHVPLIPLAARIAPYRLTRHVARVILIAAFLTPSTISEPVRSGWMPRSMLELRVLLADQRIYIVMIFWAIVAHLVLLRAKGFHARWDRGLEFVRLRPKSL